MKISLRQRNPENLNEWIIKEIYLDSYLKSNLDLGIKLQKQNFDQVWFIDGMEGSGKTNLAMTCAYYVSPEERRHNLLSRIVCRIESADKVILDALQFDSIVIDEAFGGMSSMGFMSKINRLLQRRFVEIRAKNLFVFIVAPSFMDISRYFAIWRSRCLLHIYLKGSERGRACFFNYEKKKKLYILGKKQFYNYGCVSPNFLFRFTNEMPNVINVQAYFEKKRLANLESLEASNVDSHKSKKDFMKELLVNNSKLECPLTQEQLSRLFGLSSRTIRRYNQFLLGDSV